MIAPKCFGGILSHMDAFTIVTARLRHFLFKGLRDGLAAKRRELGQAVGFADDALH